MQESAADGALGRPGVDPLVEAGESGHRAHPYDAAVTVESVGLGAETRLIRLSRFATDLAAALDVREVVRIACAEAAALTGMEHVDLAFVRAGGLVSAQAAWPLPEDFRERYGFTPLDVHLPTTEAARTARTVVVEDLLAYQAGHPALQADVAASGFKSAVVVPLEDDRGGVLGVLGLVTTAPRTFDDDEIATIELAVALIASAVRRTQRGSRIVALADLATRLAGSLTSVEVAEAVRDLGAAALGADFVNIRLLDPARRTLVAAVDATLPPHVVPKYAVVSIDDTLPIADAARQGTAVWLDSFDAIALRYPQIADDAEDAGFRAMAALPLFDERGRVSGVLAAAWHQSIEFDPVSQSTVQTVVELATQALGRAHAYDTEHELVVTLQRRLLGEVVSTSGLDAAAWYVPAATTAGIGGDWFDLVQDGRTSTAVIGDVAGHGIDAVAAMVQARTSVLGALRSGTPLAALFDHVERMLGGPDEVLVTVAVVELALDEGRLRYTSAGHPWVLVRRADGEVVRLDGSQRTPLGAPTSVAAPVEVAVQPGDVVLLYTDGVVERRGEPVTDGVNRLARRLAASDPSLGAAAVIEQVVRDDARAWQDDAAVLCLRVLGPVDPSEIVA